MAELSLMSDSFKLSEWLKELSQARGRAKQTFLKEFPIKQGKENTELLKWYLHATYEPSITYGVTEAALPANPGFINPLIGINHSSVKEVLKKLSERTLTGSKAVDALAALCNHMDAPTHDLLVRLLARDSRAGVGVSTINNVFVGLLSSFDVMLAAKFESNKIKFPVFIEPKYDGMRTVAIENTGGFDFFTRSGKEIDSVPEIIRIELLHMAEMLRTGIPELSGKPIMFDGELMGETFADTMKNARRKDHSFEGAKYHVFDVIPRRVFYDLSNTEYDRPYKMRRDWLEQLFKQIAPPKQVLLPAKYIVGSVSELDSFYDAVRKTGHEGLILKNPDGLYRPTRHRDWMKMKASETLDLPIVDMERGTGKYSEMMGAIVVDHKGVRVSVGTGFSDSDREQLWKWWSLDSSGLKSTLAEVGFQEITPDGSLRHPRFVRLRSDKSIPESFWS